MLDSGWQSGYAYGCRRGNGGSVWYTSAFPLPAPMLHDPLSPQNQYYTAKCLNYPGNKYDQYGMLWDYSVPSDCFVEDKSEDWDNPNAELDNYGRLKYDSNGYNIQPHEHGESVYYGSPNHLNYDNQETKSDK